MNTLSAMALAVAVGGGCYTAYVDFHATEVQATLLVLLISAFIAGCIHPRTAWLAALIIPSCLVAAHVIAPLFGIHPVDSGSLGSPFSLLILSLPAAISAYLGAGIGYAVTHAQTH